MMQAGYIEVTVFYMYIFIIVMVFTSDMMQLPSRQFWKVTNNI